MHKANTKNGMFRSVAIAALAFSVASIASAGNIGNWRYEKKIDSMTDVASYTASVRSAKGGLAQVLGLKCSTGTDRQIWLMLVANGVFLRRGMNFLMLRIDDNDAKQYRASYQSGNAAVIVDAPDTLDEILSSLSAGKRLRTRVFRENASGVDAEFAIRGSQEVISKLKSDCSK